VIKRTGHRNAYSSSRARAHMRARMAGRSRCGRRSRACSRLLTPLLLRCCGAAASGNHSCLANAQRNHAAQRQAADAPARGCTCFIGDGDGSAPSITMPRRTACWRACSAGCCHSTRTHPTPHPTCIYPQGA
jgi:hypothetical protein